MLNTTASLLLVLYSAIIVVSYVVVRQGWVRAYPVFVISGIANAMIVFAFSLMRGNMLLQAVVVGPITGFIFAALSVVIATLYRDMAPARTVKLDLMVPAAVENLSVEQGHGSAA